MKVTAEEVIERLGLSPLPFEGGYYRETLRSAERLPASAPPLDYAAGRSLYTAIYYLVTPESGSALHKLQSDEVWHFYLGDPVEQVQLWPDGSSCLVRLGHDLRGGCVPQALVPGGVWQSTRLAPGGAFALLGTTMAPGFDVAEFTAGSPAELAGRYPLLKTWRCPGQQEVK